MIAKMIAMALSVFMMFCVSACSDNMEAMDKNHDSIAVISESEDIEAESTEGTILLEALETYQTDDNIIRGYSSLFRESNGCVLWF